MKTAENLEKIRVSGEKNSEKYSEKFLIIIFAPQNLFRYVLANIFILFIPSYVARCDNEFYGVAVASSPGNRNFFCE